MAANRRWKEQDTIKFVKLYKAAESLWDTRHPGYRNRMDREEASDEIIRAMDMPDFGPVELKNKIKNIRSTYAQELNKVKRASIGMEGGENYRTSLCWFNIADSFLKPMFNGDKKSPAGSGPQVIALNTSGNPFSEEDQYITLSSILSTANVSSSNSPEVYYPPLSVDVDEDGIKTEIIDDDDDEDEASEYHHQAKKPKVDDSSNNGPQIIVHNNSEDHESNDSVSGEVKIQDEFFYFGKNVECQLRQMSLDKALECQFKILEVLAQYRIPS